MSDHSNLRIASQVIHAGQHAEPVTGAVMPPIFTSTTYAQESPGVHKGFEYSRSHNPTRYALERMIAKLEGSTIDEDTDASCGGFAFSSGLAAMATALELLDAGSHIISMDDIYGGSNRLLQKVRQRTQNLDIDFVDLTDLSKLEAAMRPDTAMLWVETPTNPTLKIVDIKAVADMAHKVNPKCIVVVDNTFCSPVNQRPLAFGADIVMHSSTKYVNGHSDVVGGILVTGNPQLAERIRFLQNAVGSVMGPFDSYLTLRGLKTLDVRIRRHNASALRIAKHLEKSELVDRVVYPGLESHPQHAIYKKQMEATGGGTGMITFFIKGGLEPAKAFLETVSLFTLAESLGGIESLIEHPAIMTHASVPPEQRAVLGIDDALIRLSVGIEDCDDLIADVDAALEAASAKMGALAN
ncbi:MAG: trans-sulfuration enzyme family protein [Phycisphaerales bacterium JB050]